MIFNGYDFSEYLRVNPTRRMNPPVTVKSKTVQGRDGSVFMRSQLDPLPIPVHVRLNVRSHGHRQIAKLRRKLTSWLVTGQPAKLVLPDEPDLYYMAMLTNSAELSNLWSTGAADLEFTAYDPVAYGTERRASVGASAVLPVGGTYETWPTFDLTATSAAKVKVLDYDTGAFVMTSAAAASGAHVVVDMQEQTIRVNGNLAAIDLSSDFFALNPGDNSIRITGATGTASWIERWV